MKILITGATSGIGRATADYFAREGHSVVGLARRSREPADDWRLVVCDVLDYGALESVRDTLAAEGWAPDALICCAASQGAVGPAMTLDPADWSKTVRENVEAQFFPVRAFYSALLGAPGGGRIVCFSGGGATGARPGFSAYGAGKTAVVRMVETLAQEWGTEGPAINAIAPGVIRTEMTEQVIKLGPDLAGKKEYEQALATWEKGGADLTKVLGLLEFLINSDSRGLSGRLIAAQWDDWVSLKNPERLDQLMRSEAYTLRRTIWNA